MALGISRAIRDWMTGRAYFEDADGCYHALAASTDASGPVADWDALVRQTYPQQADFLKAAYGQTGAFYPDLDAVQTAAFHRVRGDMNEGRGTSDYPIYAPGTSDVIGRRVTTRGQAVDLMVSGKEDVMAKVPAERPEPVAVDPIKAQAYTDGLRAKQATRGKRRKADGSAARTSEAIDALLATQGIAAVPVYTTPPDCAMCQQPHGVGTPHVKKAPDVTPDVPAYTEPVVLAEADAPAPEPSKEPRESTLTLTGRTASYRVRAGVHETYEYGLYDEDLTFEWDINIAQARANGQPVETTDTRALYQFIVDGNAEVDGERVANDQTIDPDLPVIAIPLPYPAGVFIVIDGWHRIARCHQLGRAETPVVLLDADDERACRIRPTDAEIATLANETGGAQ